MTPNAPALELLPAVDVQDGQAVRLVQGEAGSATSYGDPVTAALDWQRAGAEWIHLVDLDAAFGRGDNREVMRRVVEEIGVKIELSGGIRDTETYDALGIQLVRWHKLSINASMNVSGVLAGCLGNDAMTQDPFLRDHLEACMHEVLDATPKIYGVPLPDKFATPEAIIRSTERNKNSRSSMVQDWLAHRPIELQAILGNGLRVAQEHGVVMPRLATMYALLQSAFQVHMAAT